MPATLTHCQRFAVFSVANRFGAKAEQSQPLLLCLFTVMLQRPTQDQSRSQKKRESQMLPFTGPVAHKIAELQPSTTAKVVAETSAPSECKWRAPFAASPQLSPPRQGFGQLTYTRRPNSPAANATHCPTLDGWESSPLQSAVVRHWNARPAS